MGKICPKCNYQRTVNDPPPESSCPRCGLVYHKYEAAETAFKQQATNAATHVGAAVPRRGFHPLVVLLAIAGLVGVVIYRSDILHALETLKIQPSSQTTLHVSKWSCRLVDERTIHAEALVKNISDDPLSVVALVFVKEVPTAGPQVFVGTVHGTPENNPIQAGDTHEISFTQTLDPNRQQSTEQSPGLRRHGLSSVACNLRFATPDGEPIRHSERRMN